MTPFDQSAEIYLAGGLLPIPVRGKSTPVKGATGYDGTVTFEKVNAWLHPDPVVRANANRGAGIDNIGIRHQLTLAVDVDHGYGEKNGVEQLAAYAAEHNLPPLPATWSSTARGDNSPSRQYLYRIPADISFKTKPCKSVELCTWHHRYTVCAPSIHPDTGSAYTWYLPGEAGVPPTWGEPTDRVPRADMFAPLPAEWFEALRGNQANADRTVEVVAPAELVANFPAGDPDGLVNYLITKWSDPAEHVGHDEFKNAAIHAFLLGREGHTGVRDLLDVLWRRYIAYLNTARPDTAVFEARSLVNACATIAQQKPIKSEPGPVDDDTWAAFIATFTEDPRPRMAHNRATWLREAVNTKPNPDHAFRYHAVKAFSEVIQGHYSATSAVAFLSAAAPHGAADTTLRACLAAALSNVERPAR